MTELNFMPNIDLRKNFKKKGVYIKNHALIHL